MLILEITYTHDNKNISRLGSVFDIHAAKKLIEADVIKNKNNVSDIEYAIKSVKDKNGIRHSIDTATCGHSEYRIWNYQAKDI